LIAGYLIDQGSWRMAYFLPGVVATFFGVIYLVLRWQAVRLGEKNIEAATNIQSAKTHSTENPLPTVTIILFVMCALGSMIFQSSIFMLPKIIEEQLYHLPVGKNNEC
jgi:sugar phosphate permease